MLTDNPKTLTRCFIDIETTGLDWNVHEIIEIGVVKLAKEELVRKLQIENAVIGEKIFEFKIENSKTASYKALKINGHSIDELQNRKIDNRKVFREFASYIKGSVLWGWNITFDILFIMQYSQRYGISVADNIHYHYYDVAPILYPEVTSMSEACRKFYLSRNRFHNALQDAMLAYQIYKKAKGDSL